MRFKLFLVLGLIIPFGSFANNSIAKASGFSDGTLLILMSGFIVLLLAIIKALSNSIEGIAKSKHFKEKKEPNTSAVTKTLILIIAFGSSFSLQAAETVTPKIPEFVMSNTLFWVLLGLILFLAFVIGLLFNSLNTLLKIERGESFEEVADTTDVFTKLKLTDRVPVEKEVDIMLDHEYDGIRELDNNLPPWWKYMFYASIVFAFIYIIRFHITGSGQLQGEEYAMAMEEAVAAKAELMASSAESITEENVVYLVDAPSIERGGAIYKGNCATCHGQLGEGGAGPNLTDEYWLHGGSIKSVFKSIKYGIPAKGMIAWQSQFSPSQMQQIASYVLSMQGSNPPGGKSPQGEIYVEKFENTEGDSTTVVLEID